MSAFIEKQKLVDYLIGSAINLEKQGDDTENMMSAGIYYSRANECREIKEKVISGFFDWQPDD